VPDITEIALEDNEAASPAHVPVRAPSCELPMRRDAPLEDRAVPAPQKDIHKTTGGRIVNTGIYYGLGWLANSALALFFTYGLNPRKEVKVGKEKATDFIVKKILRNEASHGKTLDSVRSTVEMLFMLISGTVLTGVMTPLVKRRGKMAHSVNQWLGNKDKNVLPDDLIQQPEPKTLEDKINQEIHKRVNRKHSTGDLWKARGIGMGLVIGGDFAVNRLSRTLENHGHQSVDTLAWRLGQKIHDHLQIKAPKVLNKWIEFFEKHGAKFSDVRTNMKDHFDRLEKTEKEFGTKGLTKPVESRMVISEQTRLITKEAGWTMVMALMLHQMVKGFNKRRVKKEEAAAIAEATKQGFVPEGYKVVLDEGVKLERIDGKDTKWADKSGAKKQQPEKQENFVAAVDNSRTGLSEQRALN